MKFILKKIGGGHHPIVRIKVNGKLTDCLVDTGANITVSRKSQRVKFSFGGKEFKGIVHKHTTIFINYELIIGNDVFMATGAMINYRKKEITFDWMFN